jgi:dGTPase
MREVSILLKSERKIMTNNKNNENWKSLLNEGRRKKEHQVMSQEIANSVVETRTEIERDFDRILFSTPVRRLADKTQVFPLDKNDSVRTRLTHSHEVSNLARSIGTTLAFNFNLAGNVENAQRNIPALLASAGLAHDLGNPPFGHQGEGAIQSWFMANAGSVLVGLKEEQHRQDFLLFEGNAQGFRLLTRLQLINDDYGLDLTHASLAALMKYPTPSHQIDKKNVAKKKHGFFASEQHVVDDVHKKTGLALGRRHPLAYLMEACDDIAYTVLDAEDAVKKGLASFSDLMAFLTNSGADDLLVQQVVNQSKQKHTDYQAAPLKLSPAELNDVSMQRFRVFAIGAMVRAVTETFRTHEDKFVDGTVQVPLLEMSTAEQLRKSLKEFSFKHAYTHRSVLEVELQGYNVIRGLMDLFWVAIIDRTDAAKPESRRRQPFTRFIYGRISENYRRIFENPSETDNKLPLRYRECILLTDMISGMTDSFAVNLYEELMSLKGDFDLKSFFPVDAK